MWAATIDYTPDHLPILGPALDADGRPVDGVTVASAAGHGMMWGPGVSRAAADLVLTGGTDVVDATILGLDRFDADGQQPARHRPDRAAVPARRSRSRHRRRVMTEEPIRSVLYGVQEAAGAQFMEDSGWVWTTTFGDAEAEYTAVRENAGMWDVYGLQKWDVSGPDAAAAVQRTFTGDVARLAVGQVKYGPFVAEDGLMADDGTVYKHADDHFWVFTNSTTFADFLAASTRGPGLHDREPHVRACR